MRARPTSFALWLGLLISPATLAAPGYIAPPPAIAGNIKDFDAALRLTDLAQPETGLSVAQRRALITFDAGETLSTLDNSLTNLTTQGRTAGYLYKYLDADRVVSGALSFDTGATGSAAHLPVILDLGEQRLEVQDALELQGALVIATVNSFASSGAIQTDGRAGLGIDASRSGRLEAGEILEVTQGTPANVKFLLDLNSTFEDGAHYSIATEDNGTPVTGINDRIFSYDVQDVSNSRLYDTSYVINSSAARVIDGANESIVVTLSRSDDEYITKARTRNHPSDAAALALGRIAADGVALGDMQAALTLLDINDFGYGDNATHLAEQVKRLAPIANHSLLIAHLDAIAIANTALDTRLTARRGDWSGHRNDPNSLWVRTLFSDTDSSGSVPTATDNAQDGAGHDGFASLARGVAVGYDRAVGRTLLGVSLSGIRTDTDQADDRAGEASQQHQHIITLYSQHSGRLGYGALSLSASWGEVQGVRRTAVGRVASYTYANHSQVWRAQAGRRFDMGDGRSAITPHVSLAHTDYTAQRYQEQGAGALSLELNRQRVRHNTGEIGLSVSHKRRLAGIKALSTLELSHGRDFAMSDRDVRARYTGATHDAHPSYTAFTTPTEAWARDYIKAGLDLQFEPAPAVMLKLGVNAELRQNRQRYSSEVGMVWAF